MIMWRSIKLTSKVKKYMDFPGVLVLKNPSANEEDAGLISGSGRSEMETHSSIFAWENPMSRGAGYSHGVARVGHDFTTKQQKRNICIC